MPLRLQSNERRKNLGLTLTGRIVCDPDSLVNISVFALLPWQEFKFEQESIYQVLTNPGRKGLFYKMMSDCFQE